MTSRRSNERGFTLIELMIATAIMGIVTSQVFMVMSAQKRVYISNERVLDVQEDSRTVVDLISFDARMAGFMVPEVSAVSSFDGGAPNADSLCISDSSYFDFPSGTDISDGLDTQSNHFFASTVALVGAASATLATRDSVGDNGINDFGCIGRGIILSDGVRSHCARITGIVGNTLSFAPNVPNAALYTIANIRAVPAVIYELNEPALTLTRNGLTLATGVEDLQVEYWVDNDPQNGGIDGASEFPVDDLNNPPGAATMDTTSIRRIRVSVITRTDQTEGAYKQQIATGRRPSGANRVPAPQADSFRRRRFTTSVLPRNLL